MRWLAALFGVAGLPFVVSAALALMGLGLLRELGPAPSAAVALVLLMLPALGAVAFSRQKALFIGPVLGGWAAAVVLGMPAYFPCQRGAAMQAALVELGLEAPAYLAGLAADDQACLEGGPFPPWVATPASAVPDLSVASVAAPPTPAEVAHPPQPTPPPGPKTYQVHFEGSGTSLRIPVTFAGPLGREEVSMIFDTGATLTTLSPRTARRIGAVVPGDAPRLTLRTAGGERQAEVGFVDEVVIAGAVVEGVSVAICEGCAPGGDDGLLGLNVSGQFFATVDHDAQAVVLVPRGEGLDRLGDVRPWIKLRSKGRGMLGGGVELEVVARNGAPRAVEAVDVEIACGDDAFSVQVDNIPPRGEASTKLELPSGTDCERYTVELIGGRW